MQVPSSHPDTTTLIMLEIYKKRFSVPTHVLALLAWATLWIHAQERPRSAGEKDGIKLYIRFAEPLDTEHPQILCEIENTRDRAVPFQVKGVANFPFHLVGEDGKEIEKTAEWKRLDAIGPGMHDNMGLLEAGKSFTLKIDLEKAFGRNWTNGTRLEVMWDTGAGKKPDEKFHGEFDVPYNIGKGLIGSFDITPLTGKKFTPRQGSGKTEVTVKPLEDKPSSNNHKSQPDAANSEGNTNEVSTNSTSPAHRLDSKFKTSSKLWVLGVIMLLIVTGLPISRWIARRRS